MSETDQSQTAAPDAAPGACAAALRRLIERADRGELAQAQAAIIQHAFAATDPAGRARALVGLREDLAQVLRPLRLGPIQEAYHAVVEAMIERTRETVSEGGGPNRA